MSQKVENILNLALDATQEERERSGELEVGYDTAAEGMGADYQVFGGAR